NLRKYLEINLNLKWQDRIHMAKDIASGLVFLHDNNIVHRDLHTQNVLVKFEGPKAIVKIADFGHSSYASSPDLDNQDSEVYGIVAFIDPNLLKDSRLYNLDKKLDIYSIGVIFWEISSRRPPFRSVHQDVLAFLIINGARETSVEGTPSEYGRIYKLCWYDDPQDRPSASEVYNMLNVLIESYGILKEY
ncbi:kinase-like domain-containing protein, partial [Gigaspora rosea]